jgi:hypothetical protein
VLGLNLCGRGGFSMDTMPDFDLSTPKGKQEFQSWLTMIIRKEVNSYTRQVLGVASTGETVAGGNIKIPVN